MFWRLWDKVKTLWRAAKSERATPREIFWAVFLGVFAGCTPAVGIHGIVALGLATLFRKNRLFAWLGSRISNMVFLPFIAIAEVELAHRLRVGAWVALDREHALDQARELLLDWTLGTVPVGCILGFLVGGTAWAFARRRDRRQAERERTAGREVVEVAEVAEVPATPSPAEAPRPSSGSPA